MIDAYWIINNNGKWFSEDEVNQFEREMKELQDANKLYQISLNTCELNLNKGKVLHIQDSITIARLMFEKWKKDTAIASLNRKIVKVEKVFNAHRKIVIKETQKANKWKKTANKRLWTVGEKKVYQIIIVYQFALLVGFELWRKLK